MAAQRRRYRFATDLLSKSGHDAVVAVNEAEIRHLELMRSYVARRAKIESEYASSLSKLNGSVSQSFSGETDSSSNIRKAWAVFVSESESKAKLISQCTNSINSSTLGKIDNLIQNKKNLLKKYKQQRFKVLSDFDQDTDEVSRLSKLYRESVKDSETARNHYEKILHKNKTQNKEWEKAKDKFVKTTMKLHQNHNDYILALETANCHQKIFYGSLVPGLLNTLQDLQEDFVSEWKDVLCEVVGLMDCCREEFVTSSRTVHDGLGRVHEHEEYNQFINTYRKSVQINPFIFDSSLIEDLQTSNLREEELAINDLTFEKLQHRRTQLRQQLDNIEQQLVAKEEEWRSSKECLDSTREQERDKISLIQKQLHVEELAWSVEELKCSQCKLQNTHDSVARVLEILGTNAPPKFAELGNPHSPTGEFNQSTPEVRRSKKGFTFPNLTRKSKKDSNSSENASSNKTMPLPSPDGSADNPDGAFHYDSDEDALGEYLEPDPGEIPLQEEEWFHGVIDRNKVEMLLKNEGDYLVRESNTKAGQFVLSAKYNTKARHFIIQTGDNGMFRFEEEQFPTIRELLDYHVKNKVYVTRKSNTIITTPVKCAWADRWNLSHNSVVIDRKLGQGHFGDVMVGRLKPSDTPVAVKLCKETVSEQQKQKFLAEAEILKQYDHPNIVKLIGVCADKEPVYIVMELMSGGDFLSYLRKQGDISMKKLLKFSVDAAAGMEYLASKNIIHRDLAARNCLIGSADILKISDFGMSRMVEEGMYEASNMKEIPVKWTSPEALNYAQYTTQSDIWSYGVLLWETFSYGNAPYPGLSNKETRERVDRGYRMPPPSGTPSSVYLVMKDCWNSQADKRPSFSEILRRLGQILRTM